MWWKFGLSLVVLLGAGVVSLFEEIAGSAGSENCGGCDSTPGWASPLGTAVEIGLLIWIAALLFAIAREIKRRLAARS